MRGTTTIFTVSTSRAFMLAQVVAHLLAGLALLLADLAWQYAVPVVGAVLFSLAMVLRSPGTAMLRCRPDGGLDIRSGDDWQTVELSPDSVVLSWLVVLRYRRPGQARAAPRVVLPDAMARDDFRRLRVWLSWRASPASAGKPAT